MVRPVALIPAITVLSMLGCTSSTDAINADTFLERVESSDSSACALHLKLDDTNLSGVWELSSASAERATASTPAADPKKAQQDGASVLDTMAGAEADCSWSQGSSTVSVSLVVSQSSKMPAFLAHVAAWQRASSQPTQETSIADDVQRLEDGVVVVASSGHALLAPLEAESEDSDEVTASLLVQADTVQDEALKELAETFVDQLVADLK